MLADQHLSVPPLRHFLFLFLFIFVLCCMKADSKICGNLDIRNELSQLEKLRNCTVIVGWLKILLLEGDIKEEDYKPYSFPELTEIKEYLLVYRVYGLTTLASLFPNLSVIRGDVLFHNFALILFDNANLTEVGLYKLSKISRGSTRIDKCKRLCFVNTIDWSRIGGYLKYYDANINNETCGKCPASCAEGRCWNEDHCQFLSTDCHPQCIGCSKPNSVQHCYACKNYKDNGVCVSKCPPNKFIHSEIQQCVTKEECHTLIKGKWWIFKDQCIRACPDGYQEVSEEKGRCEPCRGLCRKVCDGMTVDSLSSAQQFHGCTHVNGSLIIRVNENSLAEELEKNLGHIVEISGFLKVTRSYALTSLNFLKRLRVINGTKLEAERYALIVFENENLHKLWDFDSEFSLTIKNGTFSFHYNPQLCLSEFDRLANKTGLEKNYTNIDVSEYSNGDQSICDKNNITMTVIEYNPTNVTISWEQSKEFPNNSLYFLYWMEVRESNVSISDGRDVCDGKVWDSVFTRKTKQQLVNLKPNTDYAYYIKTYVSLNSSEGHRNVESRSQIQYFKTLSDDPSELMNVEAVATSSNSIRLHWEPPLYTNGRLSHYTITGYLQRDNANFLLQRNYCHMPHRFLTEKQSTSRWYNETMSKSCCARPYSFVEINFDNLCSNLTEYVLPKAETCRNYIYKVDTSDAHTLEQTDVITRETPTGDIETYEIDGLMHYSLYVFYISACNKEKNQPAHCGPVFMVSQRTLKKDDADNIPEPVSVTTKEGVTFITWHEPKNPNSIIVAYHVEYNLEGHNINRDCINKEINHSSLYEYNRTFLPGTYFVSVRAVSLAGPGNPSAQIEFSIPFTSQNMAGILTAIVLAGLFVICSVLIGFYCYYRRKQNVLHLITSVNPDYAAGSVYVEDEWELDRKDVEIIHELGQGTFGMVCSGLIKPGNIPCAIKTVNETATVRDRMEFLNEAAVMKAFNKSYHVVRLLGVVSRGQPPLVVMELMERGDLKSYLRRSRDSSNNITCAEMYRMAAEIADGMAYLSAKKFVHRDLATRNCMVGHDRTVKVGDFGMARDIYETDYYRKESKGLFPVRWMAPESLADGVFTSDSDVWSYGVVLWEMATLAEQPYQGLSSEQVVQFVISKGTLERPAECPQVLYEIMEKCWMWRPIDRPLFTDIVRRLESCVGQDFCLISFYHSREGEEHRLNAKQRVYNPPAVSAVIDREPSAQWNISDEEIHLYSGEGSHPSRYLPFSYQRC